MIVPESQFNLAAVQREWRGKSLGVSRGRYPVEYDPIRRYCHMTGETNPLFLDREAAASGPYGAVICPPAFIRYFVSDGAWPGLRSEPSQAPRGVPRLGDRGVNMGVSWEFLAPVLVGDELRCEWQVEDIYIKLTKLDPKSIWVKTKGTISNQRAVVVAIWRNTLLLHRTPAQLAAVSQEAAG